jgi:acyl carrier protein
MSNESQSQGEVISNDNEESLVRELIRKLVSEMAPPGSPEVQPEHILREELGYDSVREVEITFVLEELFGFESFVVEDAPVMETVGDLENFTLAMIAQGRATVPTRAEIDRVESITSTSARAN